MIFEKLSDPLLISARVAVIVVKFLLGLLIFASLLTFAILIFQQGEVAGSLIRGGSKVDPWLAQAAIFAFVALLALLFGLFFRFAQMLGSIIDEVAEGDPFIPLNAERLAKMGWITLAAQAVALILDLVGTWLNTVFPQGVSSDNWSFTVDGSLSFSPEGILLAVLLFILARVFRKGTEMRTDLEGTV